MLREGIANDLQAFEKVISDKKFVATFGEILGEKNKVLPQELKEAAGKQPLIFNKQFYVLAEFPASLVISDKLMDTLMECYSTIVPLEQFFNQFIVRK